MTTAVPTITSASAASTSGARLKTHREGPVLVLTISNPAARNALDPSVYRAAAKALRATSGFRTVRAIVLCGEGEHFSGGGDLRRVAGGFSLCLACDLIVAAEDAKFAMSYVNVGLTPDGGGSDSLVRSLPSQAALEMLLDGTPCSAKRLHDCAARHGLRHGARMGAAVVARAVRGAGAHQAARAFGAGPQPARAARRRARVFRC